MKIPRPGSSRKINAYPWINNFSILNSSYTKCCFQFFNMIFTHFFQNSSGKSLTPYIRGSKPQGYKLFFSKALDFEPTLTLNNINPFDINGEVKALGHTLTVLKNNAENIYGAHKHANNKKEHTDPKQDSYDPIVSYNLSKV